MQHFSLNSRLQIILNSHCMHLQTTYTALKPFFFLNLAIGQKAFSLADDMFTCALFSPPHPLLFSVTTAHQDAQKAASRR